MGRFRENVGGITSVRIHPGCYFVNACDHAVLFRFTPISAQKTIPETAWLVRPDAIEDRDSQVDELVWLWKVTTEQDKLIIDRNQKGINSSAYEPGPLSEVEYAVICSRTRISGRCRSRWRKRTSFFTLHAANQEDPNLRNLRNLRFHFSP
jgi:Rieske 2Fe-2S family protein